MTRPSPRPQRVLVVDDDAGVRATLVTVLETCGHTAIAAQDGAKGLEALREFAADVVITDLKMPEMSGWEVARFVKRRSPQTPVILLTGVPDDAAGEPEAARAVDLVLRKPIRIQQLLAAITEVTSPPQQ